MSWGFACNKCWEKDCECVYVSGLKADLEARVIGLALSGVDILITKERRLAEYMAGMELPNVGRRLAIMVVNDFDDIAGLPEIEMNKHGWFKKVE